MDRHGVDQAAVICARLDGNDESNAFVGAPSDRTPTAS